MSSRPPKTRPVSRRPSIIPAIDRAQITALATTRPIRLARVPGLGAKLPDLPGATTSPSDNPPPPWLHLTPGQLGVEGRGRIEINHAEWIGRDTNAASAPWMATFNAISLVKTANSTAFVRPQLILMLDNPAKKSLVEITLFAHDSAKPKPEFKVFADTDATFTVADAKLDVLSFIMHDFAAIEMAVAANNELGKQAGWGFFEAVVTPLP